MQYKLQVKDDLKWIGSISELKNTNEVLVLYVNFHPKRLMIIEGGSYEGDKEYQGVAFMKDEETLYAEGDQIGEVMVMTDNKTRMFIQHSKYELTLAFINDYWNESEYKVIHSE